MKIFKWLIEEIYEQDRESMQHWWNKFYITKAISDIEVVWDEVSQTRMSGV